MHERMLKTLMVLSIAATSANQAAAQTPALDARVRSAVIDSIAVRLERQYVDLDTARMIGAALRARLKAGAYDTITTPARFAEVVTRHMRLVNNDRHLSLQAQGGAPGGGGGPQGPNARQQNFGISRVEVLPGNIGYLEIRGFMGQAGYQPILASALKTLENTDGLIIDVRRNGGGSSEMSHMLFSHFLSAQPVNTIKVFQRATNNTQMRQSFAEVVGPRRTDVPLYLLTSQGTASAAEEFSFVLKNAHRATLVGDRTAGAGHMVNVNSIGHGFAVGISITRVMDARTGLEWEGAGVQPDVKVAPELALDVAHAAALRRIAPTRSGVERALLERTAESLDARVKPVAVDAAKLRQWVGAYDEGRSIAYREGRLWYSRREGVMADELIPLAGDRFAVNGAARVSFVSGPRVVMTVEGPDGTRLSYVRLKGE
jgi:retinol-binding protein 3